jgi:hypothetical protein
MNKKRNIEIQSARNLKFSADLGVSNSRVRRLGKK